MSGQCAPSRRSRFTSRSTATEAASRCATSRRSWSTASRITAGGGLRVRSLAGARDGLAGLPPDRGTIAVATGVGTDNDAVPDVAGAGDGGATTDARRAAWDRSVTSAR